MCAATTEVRKSAAGQGEPLRSCPGCGVRERYLFWLAHVETQLPLTVAMCGDCFSKAADKVRRILAAEVFPPARGR